MLLRRWRRWRPVVDDGPQAEPLMALAAHQTKPEPALVVCVTRAGHALTSARFGVQVLQSLCAPFRRVTAGMDGLMGPRVMWCVRGGAYRPSGGKSCQSKSEDNDGGEAHVARRDAMRGGYALVCTIRHVCMWSTNICEIISDPPIFVWQYMGTIPCPLPLHVVTGHTLKWRIWEWPRELEVTSR